jgi:RecA/RadA recombinase
VTELYGPSPSKTTLALRVAEAQKLGGVAAFVDAEHSTRSTRVEDRGESTIC